MEQNNGVAKGVGEWALTVGFGDAGEGGAAVGGARYTGEIVACGASRIVEGDTNLVGVIWVSRRVRLRLNNVGGRLGASDQIDIRGAICQRCLQLLDQPREGATGGT